jgi:ectoine hydroxylase-related dioxygenase (phytanoyl-CoA dioxygenase family)
MSATVYPHVPKGSFFSFKRKPNIDPSIRKDWEEKGFAVIKNVFSKEQVAQYNQIVSRVRSQVDDGKDESGYGDRIGQLHQREPGLLEFACEPSILNFLKFAFGEDPVLMGSLQFERGTQQDAHIDAIFFWPQPTYSMAGVWVALEDIHEDSGPLFYIPGSHRWPFSHSEDVVANRPELSRRRELARTGKLSTEEYNDVIAKVGQAWSEDLDVLHKEMKGEKIPIHLKAGDVVIWHSLVAHGGTPRNDPKRSRRSAVFHYLGASAKLYSNQQFMLFDSSDIGRQRPQSPALQRYKNLTYMRFPFFTTYSGGKETLHHLDS